VPGAGIVDVTLALRAYAYVRNQSAALWALCLLPQLMSSHVMPEMGNAAEALEAALSSSVGGVTVDTLLRIWTKP